MVEELRDSIVRKVVDQVNQIGPLGQRDNEKIRDIVRVQRGHNPRPLIATSRDQESHNRRPHPFHLVQTAQLEIRPADGADAGRPGPVDQQA
jgi:hypothetical protein